MICEPLVGQPIWGHLASLELADIADSRSTLTVHNLIGADYYWEIVMGKLCVEEGVGPQEFTQGLGGYYLIQQNSMMVTPAMLTLLLLMSY